MDDAEQQQMIATNQRATAEVKAEREAKREEARLRNLPLSPKQYRFCQEYVKDSNASRAARDAGYSVKTAPSQAHELLKKPNIAACVADMQRRIAEMAQLDATYVLTNIKETGERCLQHHEVTDHEGNGLGEFVFNAAGANKSWELLGRHLKLFTDSVDHNLSPTLASLFGQLLKKEK